MKKIIVATDFSVSATNAAHYATDMAMALQASLVLLHSYELPTLYTEVPVIENIQGLKQDAVDALERLKKELLDRSKNQIAIEAEVHEGPFFTVLTAACETVAPYAVVMGSQGTTAAERFFFGGHTVHAVKHLHWPLVTIPKGATFTTIQRIGLALDFDKTLETTPVVQIKKWVSDFNAELHILNAGNEKTYNADIVHESGVLRQLLGDIEPHYHFITNNDLDEGVMEFAEKNNIDLLVVLPKRHNFIEQLVFSSHTKNMVLHCPVPIVALHQ